MRNNFDFCALLGMIKFKENGVKFQKITYTKLLQNPELA